MTKFIVTLSGTQVHSFASGALYGHEYWATCTQHLQDLLSLGNLCYEA